MEQAAAATMASGVTVRDVTGQKRYRLGLVSKDSTIGELIQELLGKMGLARNDSQGRTLSYRALLEREGRHLNAHELVRDALEAEDEIALHPSVEAG